MVLKRSRRGMLALVATLAMVAVMLPVLAVPALADLGAQSLPFSQNWTNTGLITTNDDWSGVPGIVGYRGDGLTGSTGTDPQTIVADGSAEIDVNANQTNPNTFTTGGVAEFEIADPVVALNGSGTADAPHLVLNLNTTGVSGINISYNLRDLDGSADNSVQQFALHFRVGSTGNYTNVPAGYVADATTGPNLATLVTPINTTLPSAADNQPLVQVRIMTTNAAGNDEWVGIDDIEVTASVGDSAPTVSGTSPADGATDVALGADIAITFSEPVDVTGDWFTIICGSNGPHPATVSGGPTSFTLDPTADFAYDETCTVTVVAANVTDQDADDPPDSMDENYSFSFTTMGNVCAQVFTPIYSIQGNGPTAAITGTVTTQGVVVGDFEGSSSVGIGGFYLQDPAGDGDAATSDGVFVYTGSADTVAAGDVVRVTGYARERFDQTALNGSDNNFSAVPAADIVNCGSGTVTPTSVTMPFADAGYPERYEGMLVKFPQSLVISEYFNYDRFGEMVIALPLDGEDRPFTGTAVDEPGAPANARTLANSLRRITLDDGLGAQNPPVLRHPNGFPFSLTNLFRGGDTVQNTVGVLGYDFNLYRIQPTGAADYTSVNLRPAAPDPVGGTLKVAGLNTLNYFLTPDYSSSNPLDNTCGPAQDQECRGWDDGQPDELTRQRAKLLATLEGLDADVIGLNELENTTGVEPLADLAAGLPGYGYIDTGTIGTDAIKVGLLYRTATVVPVGSYAILDSSVDPSFLDTKNRPVLAQTFEEVSTGGRFTVAVNHLKSKGSDCNDVGDPDVGDGQGNCNQTRKLAAQALVDWLATDPTGSGDPDFLIIGDLNSYDKEDPIDAVLAGGYTDLVEMYGGEYAYSYVFDGQFGYLDYALAGADLLPQVTGTTVWHINADESDVLDYDTSFKPAAQEALYEPNAYRSSDHDPVVVGLDLLNAKEEALYLLGGLLPTGNRQNDKWIRTAIARIEASLDPSLWIDETHLTEMGFKVFDEEKAAVQALVKVTGPVAGQVLYAIGDLLRADRILATTALDLAIATDGDPAEIARAGEALAAAEAWIARGKYPQAVDAYRMAWQHATRAVKDARFATFNASLNRFNAGNLISDLSTTGNAQAATVAEIIQRTRPEVLLINEFDYDPGGVAAQLFQDNYLSVPHNGAEPIHYGYRYVAPSNTGIPSGFDLDNSGGSPGGPNDAFGFGFFPGQYGMAVYSMYPIRVDEIRTFQNFLWKDMPGALLPDDPATPEPADWYSPDELDVFRLSSKSHWDVPVQVGDEVVHFLVSHPTPPVFDDPPAYPAGVDFNGRRNYDEIRFWADYIDPAASSYIYDDAGATGGLAGGARFVIAGDQNSDPLDGDSIPGAIQQLLDHPLVNDRFTPSSEGGPQQAALQDQANDTHLSDPAFDTADFADNTPGNLRADYVLPRNDMEILDGAVFWPLSTDPLFPLVGTFPFPSSDHRLVWIEVKTK